MLGPADHHIAFVTVPDVDAARSLAGKILSARLAACVNILPHIESHYWWKDKVESSGEVLLIIKTLSEKLAELEQFVISNHPYDTPEFVAVAIDTGNESYLKWIDDSVRNQ